MIVTLKMLSIEPLAGWKAERLRNDRPPVRS